MPTTPQAYVGRKAIKYGGRYAARKARRLPAAVVSREQPPGRLRPFLAGLAAGALIAWLLDPRRRARHEHAVNVAQGVAASATAPLRAVGAEEPDDVTLTHKAETEIFRAPDAPKGQVSVNAEDGVVYLRGEVDLPGPEDAVERRA